MANVDTSSTGRVGWRNLRTGILFVGGLLLAGSLGLIIGKNTNLLSRHDTAYLFLNDIGGLSEGNMVSILGKKIGVVESMDFGERDDTAGVIVTLDIVHDYFPLIRRDSRAIVKALGVLGDKYVEISIGRSEEFLQDGDYLAVGVEPGLEELTASALKTMNSIQDISGRIVSGEGTIGKLIMSNELNEKLMETVAHVEAVTRKLTDGDGLAARIITDPEMAERASSLVTNLSDVADSLRAGKGTMGKLMMDESFYNTLSAVLRRTDSLFAQLNSPNSTIGRLSKDDEFYQHLDHSIISLDSLLMDFKQNPDRYVKVSVF